MAHILAALVPPAPAQLSRLKCAVSLLDVSFHPESIIIRKDINRLIKSRQWSWADSWRKECDQTDPIKVFKYNVLCRRVHATICSRALLSIKHAHACERIFSSLDVMTIIFHFNFLHIDPNVSFIRISQAHRLACKDLNVTNAFQQSSKHSGN